MIKRFVLICAFVSVGPFVYADNTDGIYVDRARIFFRENPISHKVEQTPRQALVFWRRIEELGNLQSLRRRGTIPDDLLFQLKRRLYTHSELRPIAFMNGDPDVSSLVNLIRLHYLVASAEARGEAAANVYGYVAATVISVGRPIFEKLAPKYAPHEYRKFQDAKRSLSWGSKAN